MQAHCGDEMIGDKIPRRSWRSIVSAIIMAGVCRVWWFLITTDISTPFRARYHIAGRVRDLPLPIQTVSEFRHMHHTWDTTRLCVSSTPHRTWYTAQWMVPSFPGVMPRNLAVLGGESSQIAAFLAFVLPFLQLSPADRKTS